MTTTALALVLGATALLSPASATGSGPSAHVHFGGETHEEGYGVGDGNQSSAYYDGGGVIEYRGGLGGLKGEGSWAYFEQHFSGGVASGARSLSEGHGNQEASGRSGREVGGGLWFQIGN
ncbi:hypothetical protein GVX82_01805 [Patescibacteria group bacterium]|nr:hypothetical protein [Patescibacteria group bacterium]